MTDELINLPKLPKGWVWVTLKEIGANDKNAIVDGPFGSNLKISDYVEDDTGVPVLTTKNLEYGYDKKHLRHISQEKFEQLRRSEVRSGDILVAKIGSCGKIGIYPDNMPSAMIPANLLKMTVHQLIERMYVYYFLHSKLFKEQLEAITTATAQPAFNVSKFRSLFFPVCPHSEQHRIVEEIEELFTRLDAGVEALKKIKAQIKRYRQAVLKHAFEGKLTQEWRQVHQHELEPAPVLLERIKEERRKNAKGGYREQLPLDTTNLPELPEGWVWVRLEEIGANDSNAIVDGPFGSNLKVSDYVEDDGAVPVLTTKNLEHGYDKKYLRYISSEKFAQLRRSEVKGGDILVAKIGSCGKTGIYPDSMPSAMIPANLLKMTVHPIINRLLVYNFLNSLFFKKQLEQIITSTAQPAFNVSKFRSLYCPLPPLPEQHRIVEEIERRFSVADEIEKTVDHSLKQAERLRQSILKRAFEGKLVPHDPNGEPAEKLLERIKEERAKRIAEDHSRKKNKTRVTTKQMRLV